MDYLTIPEAAEWLNVSVEYVYQLIRDGELILVPSQVVFKLSVMDYEARSRLQSLEALNELVRESEEEGHYGEGSR